MPKISLDRHLLALTDAELEQFVREWATQKREYVEVQRFTGPGDMGRDVVGYLTKERHEGSWHNFQCKQYGRTLPTDRGISEVGKVLYHSHSGEFTPPTAFNRNLKRFIAKPSEFRAELLAGWNQYCAGTISEGKRIELTPDLRAFIEGWDFSVIHSISVDEILLDYASKSVLQSWFGIDPGPPPMGVVPPEIEAREMPYVQQLLDAYGEREDCIFCDHAAVKDHYVHGPHLHMQREQFFDADAFSRFYRDNTMSEEILLLRRDVLHGVAEIHRAKHADSLTRVDAVMTQAANVQPAGALARYARVPVKQGICHHFANEGGLRWRKS
jgi:hypothetical protein